MKVALQKDLSV